MQPYLGDVAERSLLPQSHDPNVEVVEEGVVAGEKGAYEAGVLAPEDFDLGRNIRNFVSYVESWCSEKNLTHVGAKYCIKYEYSLYSANSLELLFSISKYVRDIQSSDAHNFFNYL